MCIFKCHKFRLSWSLPFLFYRVTPQINYILGKSLIYGHLPFSNLFYLWIGICGSLLHSRCRGTPFKKVTGFSGWINYYGVLPSNTVDMKCIRVEHQFTIFIPCIQKGGYWILNNNMTELKWKRRINYYEALALVRVCASDESDL